MTLIQTGLALALAIALSSIALRSKAGKVLRQNHAVRSANRRKT